MKLKKLLALMMAVASIAAFASGCGNNNATPSDSGSETTDAVTTGTLTIRKPDYICISTDGGRDQLMMDGTQFTMTLGGKKHVTDSKRNAQFATFQKVLHAVINGQPIPEGDDLTVVTKNGLQTITITPAAKKRQMFTSFVLVVDAKTSDFRQLRMNERGGNYVNYDFK